MTVTRQPNAEQKRIEDQPTTEARDGLWKSMGDKLRRFTGRILGATEDRPNATATVVGVTMMGAGLLIPGALPAGAVITSYGVGAGMVQRTAQEKQAVDAIESQAPKPTGFKAKAGQFRDMVGNALKQDHEATTIKIGVSLLAAGILVPGAREAGIVITTYGVGALLLDKARPFLKSKLGMGKEQVEETETSPPETEASKAQAQSEAQDQPQTFRQRMMGRLNSFTGFIMGSSRDAPLRTSAAIGGTVVAAGVGLAAVGLSVPGLVTAGVAITTYSAGMGALRWMREHKTEDTRSQANAEQVIDLPPSTGENFRRGLGEMADRLVAAHERDPYGTALKVGAGLAVAGLILPTMTAGVGIAAYGAAVKYAGKRQEEA